MTDDMTKCPNCDEEYQVIWTRSVTSADGPHYCPFCGDFIEDKDAEDAGEEDG